MPADALPFGSALVASPFSDQTTTTVVDKADRIEVTGVSAQEVRRALELLFQARKLRAETTSAMTASLLQVMTAAGEPLASNAQLHQTQRRIALRHRLLERGYETFGSLAELRGAAEGTARQWATREREAGRLLSIRTGGRVILPSFQFNDDGDLIPASPIVVSTLRSAGLDGWQLWSWMCSPSSWVDGDVPADLLVAEPSVVVSAASEYASELQPGFVSSLGDHIPDAVPEGSSRGAQTARRLRQSRTAGVTSTLDDNPWAADADGAARKSGRRRTVAPSRRSVTKKAPAKKAAAKKTPIKKAAAKKAPAKRASAKKAPAKKAAAKKAPAKRASERKTPIKKSPAKKSLKERAAAQPMAARPKKIRSVRGAAPKKSGGRRDA